MTEENQEVKQLSFLEKLVYFSKTKEVKEILYLHIAVLLIGGIVYTVSSLTISVIVLAVALLLEMFVLHVTWIYRSNKDKEHPIRYAIVREFMNVIAAVGSILALILVNNYIYGLTQVSIFIPVGVIFVLGFFAYSGYITYKARIPEDEVN